ncbi:BON domain-containing protein [Tuwongella immobilis]|uniref:BON domain-containing protein n=1 Tax=Tuwongella immobilis TaxID=692036 RepID=A0A6C2YI47_9BACT|nr:BON domain-containing protein [Tuwongella immobilis]VIP01086.1 Transport-associated protein OS=Isosphaera pallida (strain ATCC 43644 / DSM 9630 / IS1B) GN=Isop_0895 PE=4 SV=1: BON [Tuwongella immobilis]VTR97597.1 Transport-associated protein OS=Isosphaera pallida (strain ATCC 43644 / DSM 9630 / IS1B) GN=Isop_0895 PE=4 SV=1: BON [Tuwongella immobilis]
MKLRSLSLVAMSVGCWLANHAQAQTLPVPSLPPATTVSAPSGNQALADRVAAQLRSSGVAQGADINIVTNGGKVELQGFVRSGSQRDQLMSVVKSVPGVEAVQNTVSVADVQAAPAIAPQGIPQGMTMQGFGPEPAPAQMMGHGHNIHDSNPPKMPGYAWPTYAPYNNLSRVAYPTAYPYNAWPFIGPFYPFPKVPLGWRKVTLEWEDGHWYYGPSGQPQDYWRVRFW